MEKIFGGKRKRFLILLYRLLSLHLLFLFSYPIQSEEIITISKPKDLVQYLRENISEGVLLVLDIDDTLLVAKEPILRAKQLDLLLNELRNRLGLSKDEALGFLEFSLQLSNQNLGSGDLVSPDLQTLIQDYFTSSARVIALTNVSSEIKKISIPNLGIEYIQNKRGEERRLDDLKNIGIILEQSFQEEFGSETKFIDLFQFSSQPLPVFKNGVICTNFHPKGDVLSAFILECSWKPLLVIFVDNLLEHVISVKNKMKELSIPFKGIHFNYVEKYLCNLNPVIFESQLQLLISQRQLHGEEQNQEN